MSDSKITLAKVEALLGSVVGVVKTRDMTPVQFGAYALDQVTKAMGESIDASTRRLKMLQVSIAVCKDMWDDESEAIKVPVFVAEQTSIAEQSNALKTPTQAADLNPSDATVFEKRIVDILLKMQKVAEGEGSDDAASPSAKIEEEGEEGAENKKAPPAKKTKKRAEGAPAAKPDGDAHEWPSDMNADPSAIPDEKF